MYSSMHSTSSHGQTDPFQSRNLSLRNGHAPQEHDMYGSHRRDDMNGNGTQTQNMYSSLRQTDSSRQSEDIHGAYTSSYNGSSTQSRTIQVPKTNHHSQPGIHIAPLVHIATHLPSAHTQIASTHADRHLDETPSASVMSSASTSLASSQSHLPSLSLRQSDNNAQTGQNYTSTSSATRRGDRPLHSTAELQRLAEAIANLPSPSRHKQHFPVKTVAGAPSSLDHTDRGGSLRRGEVNMMGQASTPTGLSNADLFDYSNSYGSALRRSEGSMISPALTPSADYNDHGRRGEVVITGQTVIPSAWRAHVSGSDHGASNNNDEGSLRLSSSFQAVTPSAWRAHLNGSDHGVNSSNDNTEGSLRLSSSFHTMGPGTPSARRADFGDDYGVKNIHTSFLPADGDSNSNNAAMFASGRSTSHVEHYENNNSNNSNRNAMFIYGSGYSGDSTTHIYSRSTSETTQHIELPPPSLHKHLAPAHIPSSPSPSTRQIDPTSSPSTRQIDPTSSPSTRQTDATSSIATSSPSVRQLDATLRKFSALMDQLSTGPAPVSNPDLYGSHKNYPDSPSRNFPDSPSRNFPDSSSRNFPDSPLRVNPNAVVSNNSNEALYSSTKRKLSMLAVPAVPPVTVDGGDASGADHDSLRMTFV
jgi:hypothetical protein